VDSSDSANWHEIATKLGTNRSPFDCMKRYYSSLKNKEYVLSSLCVRSSSNFDARKFTAEDEREILDLHQKYENNWHKSKFKFKFFISYN
jgi:hypothetical protein